MASPAVAVAVIAAALALAPGGLADTLAVGDEVDKRSAPLDIESIGHGHDAQGRLVHRVSMQTRWQLHALRPGRGELTLRFDLDGRYVEGHPQFERSLVIVVRRGRLYAEMRGGRNHRRLVGRAEVWRPNSRTVKVAFPRALLGRRLAEYQWYASTLVYRGDHIRGGDAAPGTTASIPDTLTHALRARLAG